jgi:hypothetical protein
VLQGGAFVDRGRHDDIMAYTPGMNWIDRLMDRLTSRGTKVVASGHPPADTEPATGSPELSEELEADYGPDSPAAAPPSEERELRSGDIEGLAADRSADEHFGGGATGDLDPPRP